MTEKGLKRTQFNVSKGLLQIYCSFVLKAFFFALWVIPVHCCCFMT